jgi:hypothetical protein
MNKKNCLKKYKRTPIHHKQKKIRKTPHILY